VLLPFVSRDVYLRGAGPENSRQCIPSFLVSKAPLLDFPSKRRMVVSVPKATSFLGRILRYGDCSSLAASRGRNVWSKIGPPVVLVKSASTMVSLSVIVEVACRRAWNQQRAATAAGITRRVIAVQRSLQRDERAVTGTSAAAVGAADVTLFPLQGPDFPSVSAMRPLSVSRFRRFRSERISEACW